MTSLATLQSMVASRMEDSSSLFHLIHYGFNSVTIGIIVGILFILAYRCVVVYQTRQAEAPLPPLRRPTTPSVHYSRNSMIRLPTTGNDPYGDPFMQDDVKYPHIPR